MLETLRLTNEQLSLSPSTSLSNPITPNDVPLTFKNYKLTFTINKSARYYAPSGPSLFLFNPSIDEIFREISTQFFFRTRKSFLAPLAGMSLDEILRWIIV